MTNKTENRKKLESTGAQVGGGIVGYGAGKMTESALNAFHHKQVRDAAIAGTKADKVAKNRWQQLFDLTDGRKTMANVPLKDRFKTLVHLGNKSEDLRGFKGNEQAQRRAAAQFDKHKVVEFPGNKRTMGDKAKSAFGASRSGGNPKARVEPLIPKSGPIKGMNLAGGKRRIPQSRHAVATMLPLGLMGAMIGSNVGGSIMNAYNEKDKTEKE